MRVDIQCHAYLAMAQDLLDNFRMYTFTQQQCSSHMAQIMKTEMWQPRLYFSIH